MKLLITGGYGFIGSTVVREAIGRGHSVVNLDAMTYAANPDNLADMADNRLYAFEKADIRDDRVLDRIFATHEPDAVLHLAAESHVDRSIDGPMAFVETNVTGTVKLMQACRSYLSQASQSRRTNFRFLHISTDEVYGSLGPTGAFTETSPYQPNSPYAASKAASDMMVRAWSRTYGFPALISNCSNNYGPYQFPEKLIPVAILNALAGKPIPIYGRGENVRDWLHVTDHADALLTLLEQGRLGETYNIGGNAELRNIDLVTRICAELDQLRPDQAPHSRLISFVQDRPGHDARYAIDAGKIESELGWRPSVRLEDGIRDTVSWYVDHHEWCEHALQQAFGGAHTPRLGLSGT